MSHEYILEHYGASEINLDGIIKYINFNNNEIDFSVSVESSSQVYFRSEKTEIARLAFSKLFEFLLRRSDSINIREI